MNLTVLKLAYISNFVSYVLFFTEGSSSFDFPFFFVSKVTLSSGESAHFHFTLSSPEDGATKATSSVCRSGPVQFLDLDPLQPQPQPVGTAAEFLGNRTEPHATGWHRFMPSMATG